MRIEVEKSKIGELIGVLCSICPARTQEVLDTLLTCDGGLAIELGPMKKHRTNNQERYYRKWAGEFAKFCGMTPDELHEELLCKAFGSEERLTKFGIRRRPLKRSGDTSRCNYSELIDTLVMTAAEMGFIVPAAQEQQ